MGCPWACREMPCTTILSVVCGSKTNKYKLTWSSWSVVPSYESILGGCQWRGKGFFKRFLWKSVFLDLKISPRLPKICSLASLRRTSSAILSANEGSKSNLDSLMRHVLEGWVLLDLNSEDASEWCLSVLEGLRLQVPREWSLDGEYCDGEFENPPAGYLPFLDFRSLSSWDIFFSFPHKSTNSGAGTSTKLGWGGLEFWFPH